MLLAAGSLLSVMLVGRICNDFTVSALLAGELEAVAGVGDTIAPEALVPLFPALEVPALLAETTGVPPSSDVQAISPRLSTESSREP